MANFESAASKLQVPEASQAVQVMKPTPLGPHGIASLPDSSLDGTTMHIEFGSGVYARIPGMSHAGSHVRCCMMHLRLFVGHLAAFILGNRFTHVMHIITMCLLDSNQCLED